MILKILNLILVKNNLISLYINQFFKLYNYFSINNFIMLFFKFDTNQIIKLFIFD